MFTLLKRRSLSARPVTAVLTNATAEDIAHYLQPDGSLWAIDLETRGTNPALPGTEIVGIGFANDIHVLYIDLTTATEHAREYIDHVLSDLQLTAFNVMFDGTFLLAKFGWWYSWESDSYGLYKQLANESYPGQSWSLESAQRHVLGWSSSNKDALNIALKERGLTKADMWQLPASILGPYSASDADAAWQLRKALLEDAEKFPELLRYHREVYLREVQLLAEQQLRGIQINPTRLGRCIDDLREKIASGMHSFLTHKDVAPHIEAYSEKATQAYLASEPEKFTKKGDVSARWLAWQSRYARYMADNRFNPNSKQQLADLFYNKLGHKVLKLTDSGRPAVDKKILPKLGEPGKLLSTYNKSVKYLGYAGKLALTVDVTGLLHPQFNSIGTVTTRLSGTGGFNSQQQPKIPEYLWAFAARPGMKLVQADCESLEPVLLAEFSQDPTLLKIYGPGAKQNDIYLFIGAQIPGLQDEIRRYYDPENPTPESIALAKKHCKRARSVAKLIHLSGAYGAGPRKIQETLSFEGIEMTLTECRKLHAAYWELFKGVKIFEQQLLDLRAQLGGWIPSMMGSPICVPDAFIKDIVNRFIQRAGHEFLQVWLRNIDDIRRRDGIEAFPWNCDQHDETVWEVAEDMVDKTVAAFDEALAVANQSLGLGIHIKAPPMVIDNYAQAKVEDYDKWIQSYVS
jgi:DNA polymerase I-like protein with 3'-5' exonuclease and polymerase domains